MSNVNKKESLLKRDGRACFYCGGIMETRDITIEHLIPTSTNGSNALYNLVLSHRKCNSMAGDLPVYVKVNRAVRLRVELILNKKL